MIATTKQTSDQSDQRFMFPFPCCGSSPDSSDANHQMVVTCLPNNWSSPKNGTHKPFQGNLFTPGPGEMGNEIRPIMENPLQQIGKKIGNEITNQIYRLNNCKKYQQIDFSDSLFERVGIKPSGGTTFHQVTIALIRPISWRQRVQRCGCCNKKVPKESQITGDHARDFCWLSINQLQGGSSE